MKTGIIRIEILAPKFRGCSPDIANHSFATNEQNKDKVFTEEEFHRVFKDYPYLFVDGGYLHEFKSNGYNCYTKYIFIGQTN